MTFEEVNDAVASERSIFSENQDYKFSHCQGESACTYIYSGV